LSELSPDAELIDVAKLPRGRSAAQEEINRVIIERAQQGKKVVRFKGGDSFVFGRGYEEALACAEAGVPCTVIPGITSAISVPALVGIPVTHRGVAHEFTVISGHLAPDDPDSLVEWDGVARLRGTVVLLMAVQNLPAIAARLVEGGRDAATPVAVICDGSMPTERTVLSTLAEVAADIEREGVRPPAIVVVGEVVAVANRDRYARA
jgi:uroporphyrin-III C-methyltransferase/precorrin-2 dehydrogenase/sirohydrochlorin ferrochelatase